ncbi:unnamed protein product [marine sediment metagenome]|uniref:Uncharacterized protein n=1 Tax=marine sediment metagenome TaxID=412755 RepID=X0S3J1_9ZZZZ
MYKPNMEDKMAKVKIVNKSVVPIHGLQPGHELEIEVDSEGTPKDKHWRRRFKDAAIDGAIVPVKKEVKKKPKQEDKD